MLSGKRIVLGVTGGIAAYRAAELASLLKKRGAEVRALMTEHACRFIAPLTLETLTGNRVHTDLFAARDEIAHIALAKWADLFVVAPATANILAKFASGVADDLLSTTYLAMRCPVLLAPAMNAAMWKHPATQKNVECLRAWGARFCGPARGHLACGDEDVGRMEEPAAILQAIEDVLCPKQDFMAAAARHRRPHARDARPGALSDQPLHGQDGLCHRRGRARPWRDRDARLRPRLPARARGRGVRAHHFLRRTVRGGAFPRGGSDVVIQAAAPADFRPRAVAAEKIKKSGEGMTLELENTTDIAAELGRRKREGQILVAFAAETQNVAENARKKLERKNADLVVANDVTRPGAGFAGDTNAVTIFSREDAREVPLRGKREVAEAILDRVSELF